MRTIKFRGKRTDTREWVYGDLKHDKDVSITGLYDRVTIAGYHVDGKTVGEFTGLLDENKQDIYEDDIVHCIDMDGEEYVTTVRYDGYAPVIDVNGRDYDYSVIGWAIDVDIEEVQVIGNIHDNPELLKGGEK